MKFKNLARGATLISTLLLVQGCWVFDDDDDDDSSSSATTLSLSGTASKGIIQSGLVTVFELIEGVWVESGTATTDESGQYSLILSDYQGGLIRMEVTATEETTMKCDSADGCDDSAFGESVELDEDFSMATVLTSVEEESITEIPITPYTNMAAAIVEEVVETSGGDDITDEDVETAIGEVSALVGYDVSDTKVVDLTDSEALEDASETEQRAAVMGAAVLNLTDETTTVTDVLDELAETFEDGSFDADDSVAITELTTAWEEVATEEVIVDLIDDSVTTDIELITDDIETAVENSDDGSYDPEASDNIGDSNVEQAKDLIADTRSLINNIVDTDFDGSMSAFGDEVEGAVDIFDRDAVAMFELACIGLEELFMTLDTEGDSLLDELELNGSASTTVPVEIDGVSAGSLTLAATSAEGTTMVLSGQLTDPDDSTVVMSFNDITLTSNLDLVEILDEDASDDTSSETTDSEYSLTIRGSVSTDETSMAISDGELTVTTDAPLSQDEEPSVISMVIEDATLDLASDGATFEGIGNLNLIEPQASSISEPLYDDLPLTLSEVSLEGTFTADSGSSINARIGLDLTDADTFDLLAFLQQECEVEVHLEDPLTEQQIASLQAASNVANATGDWEINYGSYSYFGFNDSTGTFEELEDSYGWSYDGATGEEFEESFDTLAAIVDPATVLEAEFTSITADIDEAWLYVESDGESSVGGWAHLGSFEETDDNFLQLGFSFSAALTSIEGMPNMNVTAQIDRNVLNGGEASMLVTWDGEQYSFSIDDLDTETETGSLTISNPDGVSMTLTDVAEGDDTELSGDLYVNDTKVADIETLDSGLVKVSYIDGTFETLQ